MQMIILYLWYILTTPIDKISCYLWVDELPDRQVLIDACGLSVADTLDRYTVQLTSIDGRVTACIIPASEIYTNDCGAANNLDLYHINLVIKDYQQVLCSMEIDHTGQPDGDDIASQCDRNLMSQHAGEQLQIKYMGSIEKEQPGTDICELIPPNVGAGFYETPATVADLETHYFYHVLGYELAWIGNTTSPQDWQNKWDAVIFNTAVTAAVPARLLKSMISVESQYWPLWEPSDAGEVGMLQITDSGADIALRYSPKQHEKYCSQAIDPSRCDLGYQVLSSDEQQRIRDVYRRDLMCQLCTLEEAARKVTDSMQIYADTLAAFRCYAGEVPHDPAADIWDVTVALFNAGPGCVSSGICKEGLDYLQKVKG